MIRVNNVWNSGPEGRLYYSPFSNKLHIIIDNTHPKHIEYDGSVVSEIMNYHNSVIRNGSLVSFLNIWSSDEKSYDILSKLGLYNDWDSTSMIFILKTYLGKVGKGDDEDGVSMLLDSFCNTLQITKIGERKNAYSELRR